jgi:hypothetical protein
VWVHSFTLPYTFENMKCDSWASLSACTFAIHCFGYKPKAKVATLCVNLLNFPKMKTDTNLIFSYMHQEVEEEEMEPKALEFTKEVQSLMKHFEKCITLNFCVYSNF